MKSFLDKLRSFINLFKSFWNAIDSEGTLNMEYKGVKLSITKYGDVTFRGTRVLDMEYEYCFMGAPGETPERIKKMCVEDPEGFQDLFRQTPESIANFKMNHDKTRRKTK